jgi:hypothetical protein
LMSIMRTSFPNSGGCVVGMAHGPTSWQAGGFPTRQHRRWQGSRVTAQVINGAVRWACMGREVA